MPLWPHLKKLFGLGPRKRPPPKLVWKRTILKKIEANPSRYRVGATTQRLNQRLSTYSERKYQGKMVYYAKTNFWNNLSTWENEALRLLPKEHPHNVHKESNISRGKSGYLYIIDTWS